MKELRFALFGAGFWSRFQLSGWYELEGVRCVAIYNRTLAKARALADEFGVGSAYDDPEALLAGESLDFVDIVTDVDTHARFVRMALAKGLPVVCQKPLAPDLAAAEALVAEAGDRLLVNENWRWQTPLRALKAEIESGAIGEVFRGRIDFATGFDVFANQPFLREIDRFILTDIGSHILDAARFLFGEPSRLYCETRKVHRDILGEDVATVMLAYPGATVTCNMSYAENPYEREGFPQTYAFVEGSRGTVELTQDYVIRVTTTDGTRVRRHAPPRYPWADPAYDVVHSSIVPCQADLLRHLRGEGSAETRGTENLKTVRLVFKSYESAAAGKAIDL